MASAGWVGAFCRTKIGERAEEIRAELRSCSWQKNLNEKGEEEETREAREKLIIAKTKPQFGNEIGGARSNGVIRRDQSTGWVAVSNVAITLHHHRDWRRYLVPPSQCSYLLALWKKLH